jgi:hypothetical protein
MTMLTSLKALLFPTSARQGVKGDVAPTEGSAGFAQLLNSVGTTPTAAAQQGAWVAVASNGFAHPNNNAEYQQVNDGRWYPVLPDATSGEGAAAIVPDDEKPHLSVQLAVARPESEAALSTPALVEAPADLIPANDVEAPADILPATDAGAANDIPVPEQPEGQVAAPPSTASVAVERQSVSAPVKMHPVRPHEFAQLDTVAQSLSSETPDVSESDDFASDVVAPVVQQDGQPPAQPTVTVMASPAAPIAAEPAAVQFEASDLSPASDAGAVQPPTRQPAPAVAANSVPPAAINLPVAQPSIGEPAPDPARLTRQLASAPPIQAVSASVDTAPVAEAVSIPSVAPTMAAATPLATSVHAAIEPADVAAQTADIAQATSPVAPAKPRAEAVSLLQLVRDHMSLRAPRQPEAAAPVSDIQTDAAPTIAPTVVNDTTSSLASLVQPAAQPLPPTPSAIPIVDLSASLGAQVVDMGVSGQWIDGLARDIAGLSANGAQGRFQINAQQLGPIQVDIRRGDDGTAISLTVATEAAEQALRQDSDRLKLDAGLSAVRISDVRIERAPQSTETVRSDNATNQNAAQQQSGGNGQNQGQSAGQNMGQSSAQSHMQGRGQQRENIAFGHKAGNDGAVLNHMDAGDTAGGAARARYA